MGIVCEELQLRLCVCRWWASDISLALSLPLLSLSLCPCLSFCSVPASPISLALSLSLLLLCPCLSYLSRSVPASPFSLSLSLLSLSLCPCLTLFSVPVSPISLALSLPLPFALSLPLLSLSLSPCLSLLLCPCLSYLSRSVPASPISLALSLPLLSLSLCPCLLAPTGHPARPLALPLSSCSSPPPLWMRWRMAKTTMLFACTLCACASVRLCERVHKRHLRRHRQGPVAGELVR
jgi:hypothetical protein